MSNNNNKMSNTDVDQQLNSRTFSSFGNTDLPWGLAYASRQFLPISFRERTA